MVKKLDELFDKYCNVMNQKTLGVQIGVYSIAVLGLTVAMRKVRPFSVFKKPSDVPNSFIKKRRNLTGIVERIEPNGALLMINHKPLVTLPWKMSGSLPVKVVGVNISGHGISWLQAIVAGKEVQFIPIKKDSNSIHCEVILPQLTQKKTLNNVQIGEALVAIGFGQIDNTSNTLLNNKEFKSYVYKLKLAEEAALKKQMGMKYYVKPTKFIMMNIAKSMNNLVVKVAQKAIETTKRRQHLSKTKIAVA